MRLPGPPGGRSCPRVGQIHAVDGGDGGHGLATFLLPADELEGRLAAASPTDSGIDGVLVYYGYTLIWTITLIQVTALVISAVRQSTTVLEEIDLEDQEHDLLRSPSDSPRPFEGAAANREQERRPF